MPDSGGVPVTTPSENHKVLEQLYQNTGSKTVRRYLDRFKRKPDDLGPLPAMAMYLAGVAVEEVMRTVSKEFVKKDDGTDKGLLKSGAVKRLVAVLEQIAEADDAGDMGIVEVSDEVKALAKLAQDVLDETREALK